MQHTENKLIEIQAIGSEEVRNTEMCKDKAIQWSKRCSF